MSKSELKLMDKNFNTAPLGCKWIVSGDSSVGIADMKHKTIRPFHGFYGDVRLKRLAKSMGFKYTTNYAEELEGGKS